MFIRLKTNAALMVSAAFVYSTISFAQAPIIDASVVENPQTAAAAAPVPAEPVSGGAQAQGELFYQLQLLQQEVMQLRGTIEEQAYQLKQLKDQSMERYIDLDRRLGQAATAAPTVSVTGSSSGTTVAAKEPVRPVVKAQPNEKAAYDRAYALVTSRRFDDALEAFKQFVIDYPEGKYTPNSFYWMGELYQVITPQDLESARQVFTLLIERYPGHAKIPDAMYKLGKVYFLKGNRSKSQELLNQVIADYSTGSNSSAANKARQFINANF
jgi:tol-pal system protein YbgF